jgi:hypothetical protein
MQAAGCAPSDVVRNTPSARTGTQAAALRFADRRSVALIGATMSA